VVRGERARIEEQRASFPTMIAMIFRCPKCATEYRADHAKDENGEDFYRGSCPQCGDEE
jgi:uncharacterized C2H2 Zn-finger protein